MIEVGDAQWTEETCPVTPPHRKTPRVRTLRRYIAELQPPEDEGDAF